MTAKLKKLVGDAGAGSDKSMGFDTLYDVLSALVASHVEVVTQFNQFLADYNAGTPVQPSTATALTARITAE